MGRDKPNPIEREKRMKTSVNVEPVIRWLKTTKMDGNVTCVIYGSTVDAEK